MHRRLALFDIDGTLVADGGASREAFAAGLRNVFGYTGDLQRYDFSGRTDPQIAHMVLADAGFTPEEIEGRMSRLWELYIGGLAAAAPGRARELPGIRALLDALEATAEVTLGLLTGNIEPGARIKLEGPGLNRYFPFGAFSSDSPRREELPPIAVARASAIDGHRFEGASVVIIGDSIYDVRCGVPHAATTIAIASGKTPAEKLRAENPHHFFDSAEALGEIVRAILGD